LAASAAAWLWWTASAASKPTATIGALRSSVAAFRGAVGGLLNIRCASLALHHLGHRRPLTNVVMQRVVAIPPTN